MKFNEIKEEAAVESGAGKGNNIDKYMCNAVFIMERTHI